MKRKGTPLLALLAAGFAVTSGCGGGGGGGGAPSDGGRPTAGRAATTTIRVTATGVAPRKCGSRSGSASLFINEDTARTR